MSTRPRYVLTLEPRPGTPEPEVVSALRIVLKRLLRVHGLRWVRIEAQIAGAGRDLDPPAPPAPNPEIHP